MIKDSKNKENYLLKYAVNVFYEGIRSDDKDSLWEESILLIYALDESEALIKAAYYAKENEHEYMTSDSITVKWKFRTTERTFLIDEEFESGKELFAKFLRGEEVHSLLKSFD